MPRLSQAQETARRQLMDIEAARLEPHRAGTALLDAIQVAIPADGAQLCLVDPSTLLFHHVLAVSESLQGHIQWYFQHLYLTEFAPQFTHPVLMRAGLTAVIFRDLPEQCWGLPQHFFSGISRNRFYHAYRDITGVEGGNLRAFFRADGLWIGALDMVCFDRDYPLLGVHAAFLRMVAPMIGRILRNALISRRMLINSDENAPLSSGLLVMDGAFRIYSQNQAAEQWLRLLHDAGMTQSGDLPVALWSVIAPLRTERQPGPSIQVATPSGPLRVEASQLDDGHTAVMLTPLMSSPPQIPMYWTLTEQERKVMSLVIQGAKDSQIANALSLSLHTIETHLKQIYEKVNVHSRSELLTAFFREVYAPTLTASEDRRVFNGEPEKEN